MYHSFLPRKIRPVTLLSAHATRRLLGALFVVFLFCAMTHPAHAQSKWALLIGIDQYEDGAETSGRITRLFGAVADADALGKTLIETAGFPKENVVRITTSGAIKPAKNAILRELNRLKQRVQKGDTVFVFYAGHGCEDADSGVTYLLPYDAQADSTQLLKDTALPLDTFNNYLRKLPAGLLLLAFDMCRVEVGRAGVTTTTETMQTRGLDFGTAKAATDELPQVVVKWFACKPGQKSYESRDRNRGYFSYWLEQGLRGQAAEGGQVTVASLLNYVSPKVKSEVDKIEGAAQVPNVSVDGASTVSDLSRFVLGTGAVTAVSTPDPILTPVTPSITVLPPSNFPTRSREIFNFTGHKSDVTYAVFSPDGKRIASGAHETVIVWEADTGKNLLTLKAPRYGIRTVAFSPDAKYILAVSMNGSAKIWDAETGKVILDLREKDEVMAASFSIDSKRVIVGGDNWMKIREIATGADVTVFDTKPDYIISVAFSPDGNRIITGNRNKSAKLWDVKTAKPLLTLKHDESVISAYFMPGGNRFITQTRNSYIKKTSRYASTITVWDADSGWAIYSYTEATGFMPFRNSCVSLDGKYIISGNDRTAKLCNAENGKELLIIEGHTDDVASASFSPDGKRVVTASRDKTVKIWELR